MKTFGEALVGVGMALVIFCIAVAAIWIGELVAGSGGGIWAAMLIAGLLFILAGAGAANK